MSKKYTLFIFRRDFRLDDNIGFQYTIKNYNNIIPVFIFTPEQIGNQNNYRSLNAIQFMIESLKDLDNQLREYGSRLYLFQGENVDIIKSINKKTPLEAIISNQDYTPYAIKRDEDIKRWCNKRNKKYQKKNNTEQCIVKFIQQEDYLMLPMGTLNKDDGEGEPYTVFTPFRNNGFKKTIPKPVKINNLKKATEKSLIKTGKLKSIELKSYPKFKVDGNEYNNPNLLMNGGRKLALKTLKKATKLKLYNKDRNTLSIDTSQLSAYIKFGCLSIREVYWTLREKLTMRNDLLSQLFWREFYFYISYYFPRVLNGQINNSTTSGKKGNQNYNEKYNEINWEWSKKEFEAWCEGKTGYPVVDAGMREMNQTGYMHNRARLITANFLNRMLGMDWTVGEKYYAQMLYDYDPAVNNGNWQWIASTGVDPKPYFQRLFNPWLQSQKFDPKAEYIKKWVPELKDIPSDQIHKWDKYCGQYNLKEMGYFTPIVDYKKARERSVSMYRKVL